VEAVIGEEYVPGWMARLLTWPWSPSRISPMAPSVGISISIPKIGKSTAAGQIREEQE
jgi:hypothetical protein